MSNIQKSADELADLCLEDQVYHAYTDRDLMNATLIFSHFLMDTIWTTNQNLPQEKREQLAETTGKAIRELIKASTGKDIHLIANQKP